MIPDEKRQTILLLAKEGVKLREICRKMDVSRNTVRGVIRHPEAKPAHEHDAQLLIWIVTTQHPLDFVLWQGVRSAESVAYGLYVRIRASQQRS